MLEDAALSLTPPGRASRRFATFATATGIGLLVAGASFAPAIRVDEMPQRVTVMPLSQNDAEFFFALSAVLRGLGAMLLAAGILTLVVPWLDSLVYRKRRYALPPAP